MGQFDNDVAIRCKRMDIVEDVIDQGGVEDRWTQVQCCFINDRRQTEIIFERLALRGPEQAFSCSAYDLMGADPANQKKAMRLD